MKLARWDVFAGGTITGAQVFAATEMKGKLDFRYNFSPIDFFSSRKLFDVEESFVFWL